MKRQQWQATYYAVGLISANVALAHVLHGAVEGYAFALLALLSGIGGLTIIFIIQCDLAKARYDAEYLTKRHLTDGERSILESKASCVCKRRRNTSHFWRGWIFVTAMVLILAIATVVATYSICRLVSEGSDC